MYRFRCIFFIGLIITLITGCATYRVAQYPEKTSLGKLQRELDKLFDDKNFSNAFWGVEIRAARNNQIIYQHNAEKNLMPASNMKLYTTAAALHYLGPDYQYTTKIFGNANITTEGVMQGDILIQGSGDPTISGRYTRGKLTSEKMIQAWVDDLKNKKIKVITGNIIGDDDAFDDLNLPYSWSWGYTPSAFSAQISGLSFNDNSYDLYFLPDTTAGQPAQYWLGLPTNYLHIHSEVSTSAKDSRTNIDIAREWNTNDIYATGQIALGDDTSREWGSVHNPTLYLATYFYELLQKNGITVNGTPKDIDDYSAQEKVNLYQNNPDVFFSYQSPPLATVMRILNKYSQNFYAEQLIKTVGKEVKGEGTTRKGIEAVKDLLKDIGINTDQFEMVDGCGLSRLDMVQPHQTVELLKFMNRHKYSKVYYDSLPIAGVDGTISSRMKKTAAENNVHAKTGYIGYVRCLSGYVNTKDNETLIFSFMVNNYTATTKEAEGIQDKACELLANFSRKNK